MFFQITLGDVIGWLITIASVGIAITVKFNFNRKGNTINITGNVGKGVSGGNHIE